MLNKLPLCSRHTHIGTDKQPSAFIPTTMELPINLTCMSLDSDPLLGRDPPFDNHLFSAYPLHNSEAGLLYPAKGQAEPNYSEVVEEKNLRC